MPLFMIVRGCDRHHAVTPGVQVIGEAHDGAAFPGSIPALEDYGKRNSTLVEAVLAVPDLFLGSKDPFLVFFSFTLVGCR